MMTRKEDLIEHLQELAAAEKAAPFKEKSMADDPKKTGQDRRFIALDQAHEVRSWAESLDCTEEQLRQAVEAVGNSAEKVIEYLKTRK